MNATRWMGVASAAALALGLVGPLGATAPQTDAAAPQTDAGGTRVRTADAQKDQDARAEARGVRGRLVRIGEPEVQTEGFDAERWRDDLATSDLERREASFERLLQIARRSPAARAALDEWAAGSDELAWTARMARRELGRGSSLGWLGGPPSAQGRAGGIFGGPELEQRLREIESMLRTWGDVDQPLSQHMAPSPNGANAREERQSYSIEVGPDGARVRVQEKIEGDEETREYEGETLDEILRANPELEDKIQVRAFDLDGKSLFGQLFDRHHLPGLDPNGPFASSLGQPPTDILGIEFEPPGPDRVDQLGLEPGLGLSVLRTVPGTIAHILGLQRGDVVVELNQIPVYEGNDVSRVLRERLPDAPVAVTIVDLKGRRRTLTWKPSGVPR